MPVSDKIIIVDTNCLVRLYFSPLRPILNRSVAGYQFRTLKELSDEIVKLSAGSRHAWLSEAAIQADVLTAHVALSHSQAASVNTHVRTVRRAGDQMLRRHCVDTNRKVMRSLSLADARALTTAIEVGAALATDDWPLRHVARRIDCDDDGNSTELFSTVELIYLIELEGLIDRATRISTMAAWKRSGEVLNPEAEETYRALFQEDPPSGQD
jgi:predicted nucleic acid-binding protein